MNKEYTFPKNSIAKQIQFSLSDVIKGEFGIELPPTNIHIEVPNESEHGDYASNIAMTLVKELKSNPREIAEKITGCFKCENITTEIAGPGFINFRLSNEFLFGVLKEYQEKENIKFNEFNNENVILEFTDPNPMKEFHIGHLYSNTVGESISRLYEISGANTKRSNYFGDVGMHVAKTIWGVLKREVEEGITIDQLLKKDIKERVKFLGECYAKGATAYKEDEKAAEEMKDINYYVFISGQEYLKEKFNWEPQVDYKKFVEVDDEKLAKVKGIYFYGRDWSMEYFETIYKRVGTKFDYYYPESKVGEVGYNLVKEALTKGVFEMSDGAVVYKGEKHGLHTRVFINSLGLPTYEAKELGLAPTKYEDFKYDQSIIITANEINEYFKVLLKAMSEVKPELAEKTTHIGHGVVKLPEGKMSSRTGKIIRGEWLLDETQRRVKEVIKSNGKIEEEKIDEVSDILAVGAIKYSFLKSKIGGDIVFDFSESLNFEGNSGPYLQYTYARCKSILSKVGEDEGKVNTGNLNKSEQNLLRHIVHFGEIINEATLSFSPHIVCGYLFDLGQLFNSFYQESPIIKAEPENKNNRIMIVKAVSNVLLVGLHLLGIKTVERM